jgi:hypothetical protein
MSDSLDLQAYIAEHVCSGGAGYYLSHDAGRYVCNACGRAAPYCAWLNKIRQAPIDTRRP